MSWETELKTEPGNHTDGHFSVTTPCLFNVTNVAIKWYTISVSITCKNFNGTESAIRDKHFRYMKHNWWINVFFFFFCYSGNSQMQRYLYQITYL